MGDGTRQAGPKRPKPPPPPWDQHPSQLGDRFARWQSSQGYGREFAGGSLGPQIERPDTFDRRSASSAIDTPGFTHWNGGATGSAYTDRPASPAPSGASSESRAALV